MNLFRKPTDWIALIIILMFMCIIFLALLHAVGALVIFEDGSWMLGDLWGCLPFALCNQ